MSNSTHNHILTTPQVCYVLAVISLVLTELFHNLKFLEPSIQVGLYLVIGFSNIMFNMPIEDKSRNIHRDKDIYLAPTDFTLDLGIEGIREIAALRRMTPAENKSHIRMQLSIADYIKFTGRIGKFLDINLLEEQNFFHKLPKTDFDETLIAREAKILSRIYFENTVKYGHDALSHLCLPKRVFLFVSTGTINIQNISKLEQVIRPTGIVVPSFEVNADVYSITAQDQDLIQSRLREWQSLATN